MLRGLLENAFVTKSGWTTQNSRTRETSHWNHVKIREELHSRIVIRVQITVLDLHRGIFEHENSSNNLIGCWRLWKGRQVRCLHIGVFISFEEVFVKCEFLSPTSQNHSVSFSGLRSYPVRCVNQILMIRWGRSFVW